MLYLALACAVLGVLVWAGRGPPIQKRREWRLVSSAAAVAAFMAAAWIGVRGEWAPSIALVVAGLWLASTTRMAGAKPAPKTFIKFGDADARSILGVGPDATREEIKAAYSRLMRLAHPDKGGTDGLAAQLNAARDRLLRK